MKKNLLMLFISISIVSLLQAQELTFSWAKKVNGDIISNAPITKIANKSVYVGTSKQGGANSVVMDKYNLTGKLLSSYSYSIGSENLKLVDFAIDISGNLYLSGTATVNGSTTNTQGFLAKLNAAGTLAWQKLYNSKNGLEAGARVKLDNTANVYCAVNAFNSLFNVINAIVYKYSTAGLLLNQYGNNTDNNEAVTDLAVTTAGTVAVCGYKLNNSNIIDSPFTRLLNTSLIQQWVRIEENSDPFNFGQYGTHVRFDKAGNVITAIKCFTNYADGEPILCKYNSNGVKQWQYEPILLGFQEAQGMEIRSDNSIVFTSVQNIVSGGLEVVTIAVSPAGEGLWLNQYSGTDLISISTCLTVNSNDQVFVGGYNYPQNGADWIVLAIDKNGILGDVETYYNSPASVTSWDYVTSIAVSGTSIVAAGFKNGKLINGSVDSLQTRVIKMNLNILPFKPAENTAAEMATTNNSKSFTVQAWPNPADDFTNIILPVSKFKSVISLYSAAGIKLKEINCAAATNRVSLSLSGLAAGQYFVQVLNDGNIYKTSFIKN